MGYRNLVRSPAEPSGDGVAVTHWRRRVLIGTPIGAGRCSAVVAIRPDDLHPVGDGPIAATVEIAEYHGRDFYAVRARRGRHGTVSSVRDVSAVDAPGEADGARLDRARPDARAWCYRPA